MFTESDTKAILTLLTQTVAHDLSNWLESQRNLGSDGLPAEDIAWAIPSEIKPVSKTSQPDTVTARVSVPQPQVSTVSANLRPSPGGTSSSGSMASFMALRQSSVRPQYQSSEERETVLNTQKAHAEACRQCILGNTRQGIIWGKGPADAKMVFIAAGGNPRELETGRIFTDEAAQLIDRIVQAMSDLHPDCSAERIYMTNVIKCACVPPRNKTVDIARSCLRFLRQEIQIIQPKVIVIWGEMAYRAMFGDMQTISQIRGTWNVFEGVPAMTTHHPLEMIKNPKLKGRVWQDLQLAVEKLKV